MRTVRVLLVLCGVSAMAVGAVGLWRDLSPASLSGLGTWALGAVVLHDGVLVPVVLLAGLLLWFATGRLPVESRRVIVGGAVTAGMLSLLAWPLIHRQGVVPNATVLPQDYLANLLWILLFIAVATAVGATAAWWFNRRRS